MDEFGAFKKWRTEFMQQILDITRAGSNKKYDKDGNLVVQYWGTKTYEDSYKNDKGKGFAEPKKVIKEAGKTFVSSIKSGATAIKDAFSSFGSASHKDRFNGLVRGMGTGLARILAPIGNNTKIPPPNSADKQNLKSQQNQERLLREILKKLPK